MAIIQGVNFTGRKGLEDPSVSRWKGITAPFSRGTKGAFEPKGTRDVIWSSIVNILLTPIGTRIMLPEFGSMVPSMVFEPNDDLLMQMCRAYVFDAINRWEPRVQISRADVFRDQFDDHRLHLSLTYEIVNEGIVEERSLIVSQSTQLALGSSQ